MTRDDIIRMAREAGLDPQAVELYTVTAGFIERFAALVAAAEREACAKLCDGATEETTDAKALLSDVEIIASAVAAGAIHQSKKLAAAIRARGEQ